MSGDVSQSVENVEATSGKMTHAKAFWDFKTAFSDAQDPLSQMRAIDRALSAGLQGNGPFERELRNRRFLFLDSYHKTRHPHIAAQNGMGQAAAFIMTFGFRQKPYESVDLSDADGNTPLLLAVRHDDVAGVNALLAAGANLQASNQQGEGACLLAAKYASAEMLKLILDKGAVAEADKASLFNKALLHAVVANNVDAIRVLMAEGADVLTTDDNGNTPLHLAAAMGYQNVVDCLLVQKRAEQLAVLNDSGQTPPELAIAQQQDTLIEQLIEHHSVSPTVQNSQKQTLFELAFEARRPALLAWMIENCEIPTEQRQAALKRAFAERDAELVHAIDGRITVEAAASLLAKIGEKPGVKANEAVIMAALSIADEHPDLFLLLVEEVESLDHLVFYYTGVEESPYHMAARCSDSRVMAAVDKRLKQTPMDEKMDGVSVVHIAAKHCQTEIRRGRQTVEQTTLQYIERHQKSLFNEKDKFGRTVLHYAAMGNSCEHTMKYLERVCPRLSWNDKDSEGMTPYHYAALSGNVTLLQKVGSRAGIHKSEPLNGQSLVDVAYEKGLLDVVAFLNGGAGSKVHQAYLASKQPQPSKFERFISWITSWWSKVEVPDRIKYSSTRTEGFLSSDDLPKPPTVYGPGVMHPCHQAVSPAQLLSTTERPVFVAS